MVGAAVLTQPFKHVHGISSNQAVTSAKLLYIRIPDGMSSNETADLLRKLVAEAVPDNTLQLQATYMNPLSAST
jgi:hypothetical protein